jgi:HAD superfamily hydrolase (TIGR01509 family)
VGTPAILFDVDGTLVDTNYLHTLAWWRAFGDAGHQVAMVRVHRLIGMGSSRLVTEILGHPDDDLADAHSRHYQRLKGEITPLPGGRELLEAVSDRGVTVVLATSAERHDVEDLMRALQVVDSIDHVIHSADVDRAKPDGDIFAAGLAAAGCPPDRALVLGDTVWDVIAAKKVGVTSVGVETGGNCPADLEEAGALGIYRDPAHLLEELDASPLGRLIAGA